MLTDRPRQEREGGCPWMGQLLPHGPCLEFEAIPTSLVSDPGLSLHAATSRGPMAVLELTSLVSQVLGLHSGAYNLIGLAH